MDIMAATLGVLAKSDTSTNNLTHWQIVDCGMMSVSDKRTDRETELTVSTIHEHISAVAEGRKEAYQCH